MATPDKDFSAEVAEQIITLVREGETLSGIAKRKGMPSRLTMYDWLKNPENQFGRGPNRKSFNRAYQEAQIDRSLTWQDQAIQDYEDLKLKGDRTDNAMLNLTAQKANMRLKVAKEFAVTMPKTPDSGPVVVIRKFSTLPAKADR